MHTQIGPYQIFQPLGAGGMATVHLARHLGTGEECALKVLPPHLLHAPSRLTRFQREMDIALQFDHPHIVRVFDASVDNEVPFLAMEYLPLGSLERELRERLLTRCPFPIAQAVEIARQIALALNYAHRRGVIHRDVTPGNILRASTGADGGEAKVSGSRSNTHPQSPCYKLGDFGLALQDGATRLSLAGGIGTVDYISPESILPDARVDARSDIYSLGVVLYEMLTGRPLFVAEHPLAKLHKLVHEAHVPAAQMRADVPATLNALLERALAKHPARRFQTAQEFAEALQGFQAHPTRRGWRWLPTSLRIGRQSFTQHRSAMKLWPRMAVALALLVSISVGFWQMGPQRQAWIVRFMTQVQSIMAMPAHAGTWPIGSDNPEHVQPQQPNDATRTSSTATIIPHPTAHVFVLSGMNRGPAPILARQRPGVNSEIVGSMASQEVREIIGRSADGHWWLIGLNGDATGWVRGALLQTAGNESAVPVIPVLAADE